jgi:large conductance mechanosensitive channel
MGMMKEFREFAMRGNVVDMAVGIVIGAAFGKIVSSFVSDVIMPPIGLLLGNVDFSELKVTLKEAVAASEGVEAVEAVTLNYGLFVNTLIDFVIIAFAIFVVVKAMNATRKKQEEAPASPPEPSKEQVLLTEIRDLLKAGK